VASNRCVVTEKLKYKFWQPQGCGRRLERDRELLNRKPIFNKFHSCQPRTNTTTTMDILDKIPKPVLAGFAGLGFLVLSNKVISYIQLLLSLFVLPGKNVSHQCLLFLVLQNLADIHSCDPTAPKEPGQS